MDISNGACSGCRESSRQAHCQLYTIDAPQGPRPLVHLGTPDEMRGRVSAVNFLFINASNQLASSRAA